jgi:hypothetical protein
MKTTFKWWLHMLDRDVPIVAQIEDYCIAQGWRLPAVAISIGNRQRGGSC